MTIAELQKEYLDGLSPCYGLREAQSITRLVLENLLSVNATYLSLERFRFLTVEQQKHLKRCLERLTRGEPVQYVLGEADFMGLKFKVSPAVLIPRPETEELVHWILKDLKLMELNDSFRILDIGTGSGCIPISLSKHGAAKAQIGGIDISPEALKIAEQNKELFQAHVRFGISNILKDELPTDTFQIIVSNPPYITESEKNTLAENVIKYEPHVALFAAEDGLTFYRAISRQAMKSLDKHGRLYFEINAAKGQQVSEILRGDGFKNIVLRQDMFGNDRMIRAEK